MAEVEEVEHCVGALQVTSDPLDPIVAKRMVVAPPAPALLLVVVVARCGTAHCQCCTCNGIAA